MAGRASFSDDEWALLADAPLAACAAVALAQEGGGEREANATVTGWREGGQRYASSDLVRALVADADPLERAGEGGAGAGGTGAASYEAVRAEALDMCGRAYALAFAKASPADAEAYADFVIFLAARVARASAEGGLLGIGGERVSPVERATLREIAAAMGVQLS